MCGPISNDPRTGTGPRPKGWGSLYYTIVSSTQAYKAHNLATFPAVAKVTGVQLKVVFYLEGHKISESPDGLHLPQDVVDDLATIGSKHCNKRLKMIWTLHLQGCANALSPFLKCRF